MKKRTKEEIIKDSERILKCAEIACSFKEIANLTALTEGRVYYTLYKQGIRAEVKEKIRQNMMKKAKKPKKIVLDASLSGTTDIIEKIKEQIKKKKMFIITTLSNIEFKKMSEISDYPGRKAREITNLALTYPSNFEFVLLEKFPWETVDDVIIKFAKKNEAILWTADKEMALNAQAFEVETVFFKINNQKDMPQKHYSGRNTLFNSYMKDGELYFDMNDSHKNKYCELIKDSYIYTTGVHKLNYGDEIYIAKRRKGSIILEHYKVIAITDKANVRMIYHYYIKRRRDIQKIQKDYIVFAKDAIYRFDLNDKKKKY